MLLGYRKGEILYVFLASISLYLECVVRCNVYIKTAATDPLYKDRARFKRVAV